MTTPGGLLDYADAVLDGDIALGHRAARTAALLARLALEAWLNEQTASWPKTSGLYPTMTSKLIVLTTNQVAGEGDRARRLWHSLSRALHYYAYELQPSPVEVRFLVAQVRALSLTGSTT